MNVIFLTHRLPYAPNRGDRVRAYHLLQFLRSRARVHLVSLVHDADEAGHVADLRADTASIRVAMVSRLRNLVTSAAALPTRTPLTHTLLHAPGMPAAIQSVLQAVTPDVVLAYCSGIAVHALRGPLSAYPCVLDMVDVDSAKWRDLARVSAPPLSWIYRREARVLAAFEAHAAARSASTLVVTRREQDTLRALAPDARIEVVENGVDLSALRPPGAPADSPNVVFCGVMNYTPNEQAAMLLAREVWPLVRATRPDATLTLVGSQPTAAVRALASSSSGIEVTGAVPDVRPYLWRAAISAAPILTARGIQNKVLEAVAAGLPTVVTPNILAALPTSISPAVVSAAEPRDLAHAIVDLLRRTPAERRAMAERANLEALDWNHQLAPVEGLLRDAMTSGASARRRPSA